MIQTPKKNSYSYFYLSKLNQFIVFTKPTVCNVYYKNYFINLLDNKKYNQPIKILQKKLDKISAASHLSKAHIFHLSYEFGYLNNGLEVLIPEDTPLAYEIIYGESFLTTPKEYQIKQKLEIISEPSFENYKNKFDHIYNELLDGNCYQVNLTEIFKIYVDLNPHFFKQLAFKKSDSMAPYAHGSYIPAANWGFISHSPECLFHLKNLKHRQIEVTSMPIKGTIKKSLNGDIEHSWNTLIGDLKEEAELFMITDLLRNDLAGIDKPNSRVVKLKEKLELPGIIHQYSDIRAKINQTCSLNRVLRSLFPGGSITGAPKKNVMKIINKTETQTRGFYCGSTVIFHKSMRKASINIRSMEFFLDKNQIKVGAGGGITLQSQVQNEFDEVILKFKSILSYLN